MIKHVDRKAIDAVNDDIRVSVGGRERVLNRENFEARMQFVDDAKRILLLAARIDLKQYDELAEAIERDGSYPFDHYITWHSKIEQVTGTESNRAFSFTLIAEQPNDYANEGDKMTVYLKVPDDLDMGDEHSFNRLAEWLETQNETFIKLTINNDAQPEVTTYRVSPEGIQTDPSEYDADKPEQGMSFEAIVKQLNDQAIDPNDLKLVLSLYRRLGAMKLQPQS